MGLRSRDPVKDEWDARVLGGGECRNEVIGLEYEANVPSSKFSPIAILHRVEVVREYPTRSLVVV